MPHTSRRQFIASAAALALAAPARAQDQAASASSSAPPDPQDAALAARTDDESHLTIEVHINGQGPFRFVVDTGSEQTAIADNVAQALGLAHGPPVSVDGIARRIPADTVQIAQLQVGPFHHNNLRLPVLPRQYLFADGYLGLDVIDGSRVTFDFKTHELRIDHSLLETVYNPMEVTKVQVYGSSGRLRAGDCTVDGVSASAFLDSGAEVSVGNEALKTALMKRNPALADLGPLSLSGVTGGQITGRIVPLKMIQLQDLRFTDCTLVIADVPNFGTWSLERNPALLIGMDFLRQFNSVTIDYRAKEIRFDLAGITPPFTNRRV